VKRAAKQRYSVEPCDNLGSISPPPPRDRTWIVRDRETGQQVSEHDRRADARAEAVRLNNAQKEP
jgi:hypothetical protein